MSELASATRDLGMDVLVEVHDRSELEGALNLNSELIGINNRSLQTFDTRLETTLDLIKEIPVDRLIVTESGIHEVDDVRRMRDSGVNAFLVGETFMRAADPGSKLSQLFSGEVTPE
jgi:indole-3-glycerol phosphate synthase